MAAHRVVVVGAGPAGVRAAETLVAAGLTPILVDEAKTAGGQIYRRPPANFTRSPQALYGSEADKAVALHETFDRLADKIEHRGESLAWALEPGRLHVSHTPRGITSEFGFDALILATGATDRTFPLPGWTRPGVYTLGGAQVALKAQGTAIGRRVVFAGTGPLLYLVACQYLKAGASIAAVIDTASLVDQMAGVRGMMRRPHVLIRGAGFVATLRLAGIPVVTGARLLAFEGDGTGVTGVTFATGRRVRTVACDAVGYGYHLRAESQLADLAGCAFSWQATPAQWLPDVDDVGRSSVKGVYLAGDGATLAGADAAEVSGKLAALAVLSDLGLTVDKRESERLQAAHRNLIGFRDGVMTAFPWPGRRLAAAIADDTAVCRCEMITAGEIRAVAGKVAGADDVNRAKAFSRAGMGRCQGRFCGHAAAEITAAARGVPTESVGRLRGQAPVKPLPIKTRAEDRA
jgi:NADPH-dependent 2,4-dienoyl-CoA reductase/sulfur reductase-like enzyme